MQAICQKFILSILLLFLLAGTVPPAGAAKDPRLQEFESLERAEQIELLEKQLRSLAADLLSDLGPNELQVIYNIRSNHGIIQSVRNVRKDMTSAVENCRKEHDQIQSLEMEFDSWKQDITPVIEKAETNLDKAIEKQKIVDSQKLKLYLLTLDKLVDLKEKARQKQFIKDKKACLELGQSMAASSRELKTLLQDSLKSLDF